MFQSLAGSTYIYGERSGLYSLQSCFFLLVIAPVAGEGTSFRSSVTQFKEQGGAVVSPSGVVDCGMK